MEDWSPPNVRNARSDAVLLDRLLDRLTPAQLGEARRLLLDRFAPDQASARRTASR